MADVRSLLRNERNARRISHPQATYSTTGTLVCLVCHIQLKSESLWNGHLRSAQHAMRLQRIRDGTLGRPPGAAAPEPQRIDEDTVDGEHDSKPTEPVNLSTNGLSTEKNNKRKADDDEEPVRKKSRPAGVPAGFFDGVVLDEIEAPPMKTTPPLPGQEIQIASRPATPLKTPELNMAPKAAAAVAVDEDEWAAFEADVAAVDTAPAEEAVISAPAMSAAEVAAKSKEEEMVERKKRLEAEAEGDKEDAARKLEDEFEEMEALEMRVRRLKEKREALRLGQKNAVGGEAPMEASEVLAPILILAEARRDTEEDEEDDDDDDEDDWDAFRLKA